MSPGLDAGTHDWSCAFRVGGRVHTEAMNQIEPPGQPLVLADTRDAGGVTYRAVRLTADRRLVIEGHDLGPDVESHFGRYEYEFERKLSAGETERLAELIAVPLDELLAAIGAGFASSHELEAYLHEQDLTGEFSSRIGD